MRRGRGLDRATTGPMVVLLAMLAAPGESVLRNIYVISRGYEELDSRLNALGANIQTFRD